MKRNIEPKIKTSIQQLNIQNTNLLITKIYGRLANICTPSVFPNVFFQEYK